MAVGLILRIKTLGGMLLGASAASVLLGPFFNNAGTARDNAKKLVEEGGPQVFGTPAHKAAVLGDTAGDPLKDVGPSLHPHSSEADRDDYTADGGLSVLIWTHKAF
jgi:K(+)-stimulated pyrophosphate-energized sodium pump